jgi:hypothetical protein
MTVFFSDRPERLTGEVRNDLFAKLWSEGKNSFKSDPPNAALSVFNPQGQPAQAVVVLNNPRLDGRHIQYDAHVLAGNIPVAGTKSTLFIDGYDTPCNSGASNPSYSDYPCRAATAFSRADSESRAAVRAIIPVGTFERTTACVMQQRPAHGGRDEIRRDSHRPDAA